MTKGLKEKVKDHNAKSKTSIRRVTTGNYKASQGDTGYSHPQWQTNPNCDCCEVHTPHQQFHL